MKIVPNIRSKMRAYSIWSMVLSLALFIAPEFYYAYAGTEIASPYLIGRAALFFGVFGVVGWAVDQTVPSLWRTAQVALISAALSALVMVLLALPARVMGQVPDVLAPVTQTGVATEAEFLRIATPHTALWEGLRTTAYLDRIAYPPVWTVCYGETNGVRQGDTYTAQECASMLGRQLLAYRDGLHRYFTPKTLAARLPATRDAAFVGFAYNVGIVGAGRSTAVRRLNAGDITGGCDAIGWWNKAGGRVVRGLVNRRNSEVALCKEGLA